ncbi:hypothetical protein [Terriglobus roseus]|uniref:Uncharacterized protein n=1 Tax=Terriglobus roseus TaxID=392734 RepID=A0A1G7Q3Z7_9BACT|nr:hypothetical protein [Terriglobus roseus]SDF93221.1 hypothetical protein SAMN05444167_3736 [Terriglobus roseus]
MHTNIAPKLYWLPKHSDSAWHLRFDTLACVKLRSLFIVGVLLAITLVASAETLRYRGTIGQRTATITLNVSGDDVTDASYRYDRETATTTFSQAHLMGTTLVLADEDGNIFHLHLQDAAGVGVKDLPHAQQLQGNMTRDELDLPVLLKRAEASIP